MNLAIPDFTIHMCLVFPAYVVEEEVFNLMFAWSINIYIFVLPFRLKLTYKDIVANASKPSLGNMTNVELT